MADTLYGDITPRQAGFVAKDMLRRGLPNMVTESYGQMKPLPSNSTKVMQFRRYESLAPALVPLTEGVPPTSSTLTYTDVTVTLNQYGDVVTHSDVTMDTHPDDIMKESKDVLAEQAAETVERVRLGILQAGTSVFYAGTAVSRATVATTLSANKLGAAERLLKKFYAKQITEVGKTDGSFNTENINASYIVLASTDLEHDIEQLVGFTNVKDYGVHAKPLPGEFGAFKRFRFITTPLLEAFPDAGGLVDPALFVSTGGTNADVYSLIVLGQDAYANVPFKGSNAITPTFVGAKPSASQPLGQKDLLRLENK